MFSLAATLTACSGGDEVDDGNWYRAVQDQGGWLIARADREADTCHVLGLSSLGVPTGALENVDVNVDGVHAGGLYERDDALDCQTSLVLASVQAEASGSGEVRLRETSMMNGLITACRIDIDVTVDGIHFLADDLYVWGSGCEPSPSETSYYTNLNAAYIPEDERVIVAGWDPVNEACAWIRFGIVTGPLGTLAIEAPPNWIANGVALAPMSKQDCEAAALVQHQTDELTEFGAEELGGGTLAFADSQTTTFDGVEVEVPCAIDIDVWVPFFATRYWVPTRAGFVGDAVPVAGACQ